MEYLGEIIALGIDSIIFGICLKQYIRCKGVFVKNAELQQGAEFQVGPHLNTLINDNSENKFGYVAVRGTIKSMGKPLQSINNRDITGVIQKLSVKEHVVARTATGFWTDQKRTMQEVYNTVPFVLQNGYYQVEVMDPLAAKIVNMDIISDRFEPSSSTIIDHVWSFFTGLRRRGLQTTEEMLRDGTIVTGIGKLTRSANKPNSLSLQPPVNGTPFYLTTMSLDSFLRKVDETRRTLRRLCIIFGAAGLIIGGIVARRYWKNRQKQRLAEELRQTFAASRKERRRRVREENLQDDQVCVVCYNNPLEIIVLDCGHVCLCEDCSDDINVHCPVCREPITQKVAAYII